ncbi:hypothetical protein NVP1244A_113 [Vibrio phage 1.244.A._10N.261.54.C3]|nr:hypothetical protein NVP1244A_113 [Vibrio phage 1.244.A._10N.261.54.C3]AUR98741.1 hypothetical protein NVP1255O_113 [Vibrio phage 1.255.O._10N.286.45.F1]
MFEVNRKVETDGDIFITAMINQAKKRGGLNSMIFVPNMNTANEYLRYIENHSEDTQSYVMNDNHIKVTLASGSTIDIWSVRLFCEIKAVVQNCDGIFIDSRLVGDIQECGVFLPLTTTNGGVFLIKGVEL